jgi:hypothetical protein
LFGFHADCHNGKSLVPQELMGFDCIHPDARRNRFTFTGTNDTVEHLASDSRPAVRFTNCHRQNFGVFDVPIIENDKSDDASSNMNQKTGSPFAVEIQNRLVLRRILPKRPLRQTQTAWG